MRKNSVPFDGCMIFHCVDIPHFFDPFIFPETAELFLPFGLAILFWIISLSCFSGKWENPLILGLSWSWEDPPKIKHWDKVSSSAFANFPSPLVHLHLPPPQCLDPCALEAQHLFANCWFSRCPGVQLWFLDCKMRGEYLIWPLCV